MTTKKKAETVNVIKDDMTEEHLMEATIRIAASLAFKFGVMRPTETEARQIAEAALMYGRAVVKKAQD